ncbi:hypothetical protein PInf_017585 [Phytophthora infestans]|nr:hypothetical protein PInf_017585 [Phytophthora infestans]
MFERKKEAPNNIVIKDTERMQYGNHAFSFDNIYWTDTTQDTLFEATSKCLVDYSLKGINSCCFAYGQTGSGKTFSIFGEAGGEKVGLLSRSIKYLFDMVNRQQTKFKGVTLAVSFLEIYCDRVRDLARAGEEDYDYEKARDSDEVISGMLNMVDLAGSERLKKSESDGQRLKEALHINSSLSAVGKVVMSLDPESGYNYIPYRDSKLTRLLQNSIGGNCFTTLIATIHPMKEHYEECLGTLQFANRCRSVQNQPRVNHINGTIADKDRRIPEEISESGEIKFATEANKDKENARQTINEQKRRIATLESCLQQKTSEYDRALASEAARHRDEMQTLVRRNNHMHSSSEKMLIYQQSIINLQGEDCDNSKDREKHFEQKLQHRVAALQKSKENEISLIRQQYEQSLASKSEELNVANNKLQQLQQTTTDTVDVGELVELYSELPL